MISTLFNALVHNPLYNGLVLLMDLLPWADIGVIVIIFTIIIRLILFPLSHKAVKTQVAMRALEPELAAIKARHKNDQRKQAEETLALYQTRGVNPFASIGVVIVQIPIILGLYWIFLRGGLPTIDVSALYSFVHAPETVRMSLFGFDLSGRSIVFAVLVGATQFAQVRLAAPNAPARTKKAGESLKDDLMQGMHLQMRYVMPVLIAVIAYTLSAVIALYWTTSNLFMVGQELFARRTSRRASENNTDG